MFEEIPLKALSICKNILHKRMFVQKISQTINFPSIASQIDQMYKLRKKFPEFLGREMNSKTPQELWDFSLKYEKLSSVINYNSSFGSHPSGHSSSSFGTPRIIFRRLMHPPPSVRLGSSSDAFFSLTNESMPRGELQISPPVNNVS